MKSGYSEVHTMAFRSSVRILIVLFAVSSLWPKALVAGTTGGLGGRVLEGATPVAGAKVSISSPSQNATATTDAGGRYSFVSLAPDTYTVSVEKSGYDPLFVAGVNIAADAQQTQVLSLKRALRTIGRVSARTPGSLVNPGTTADVYSVNSAQQDRVASLGGGGNLNSAYSAIATVPGAYVPANQTGYNEAVHIRGGDSGEVGYELDGIPVNRGFDNFPSGSVSALGQQELQVYTGASPADSEAQGLAGSINQVIKSGSYPTYGRLDLGAGSPAFYHTLNAEVGGANQQRTFSYYVALGGFDQDHRYIDQFNGQSYGNEFGPILFQCPAGGAPPACLQNGQPVLGAGGTPGFALGNYAFGGNQGAVSDVKTRSTIVNLHFGVPHKAGGIKDDVQLLYDNDQIYSALFSSALDEGLSNVAAYNATNSLNSNSAHYADSWQYNGALGTLLPRNYQSLVKPYLFPSSPPNRPFDGPIPLDARDVQLNGQSIVKLQYQKNFSSAAYLRLYGYTYYSNYIATGANSSYQPYTGLDSGDYEVSSHTRGVSASFIAQVAAHHLLDLQGSYTASTSLRQNNTQVYGNADSFAVLVNPNDLTSGTCYAAPNGGAVAMPTTCNGGATLTVGAPPTFATLSGIGCATRGVPAGCTPALPNAAGLTCGSAPCGFYVIENGSYGANNAVKPVFTGYSITDKYKPSDRLAFDLGLRLDQYSFTGADTSGSPARAFLFNAYNKDTCYNTQSLQLVDKTSLPLPISAPCSAAGPNFQPIALQNNAAKFTYDILQPRLGVTYTVDPDTVLRASYGKYNEQPSAAYEQYDALQQNLPDLLGPSFYSYGFTGPGHAVRPSISYNADFSLEHRFKNSDVSLKITPFLRQTHDQVENFYLNIKAGLVSGLNIGQQTSSGFELAATKGDFARNGFASQLSFAYTNSYVQFATLPNGSTIVSPINGSIVQYNAYTSFCAAHSADQRCGGVDVKGNALVLPTNGAAASACYAAGVAVACNAPGAVANPYWNAPPQPLLDPHAKYLPYTIFPAGIGTGVNSFAYPYVATLILNYKHDRFAITPSFQFQAGNRYGAPETNPGIDPAAATCAGLTHAVGRDPRYPYGAPGGAAFDAVSCGAAGQLNAIPDPYTNHFDGIGEFREPAQLLGNVRISYEASKNVELVATLTNVINRCFGGQRTAFTYLLSGQVCSYSPLSNSVSPVGNVYNPGDNVQTFLRYPYQPNFGSYNDLSGSTLQPFGAYINVRLRV